MKVKSIAYDLFPLFLLVLCLILGNSKKLYILSNGDFTLSINSLLIITIGFCLFIIGGRLKNKLLSDSISVFIVLYGLSLFPFPNSISLALIIFAVCLMITGFIIHIDEKILKCRYLSKNSIGIFLISMLSLVFLNLDTFVSQDFKYYPYIKLSILGFIGIVGGHMLNKFLSDFKSGDEIALKDEILKDFKIHEVKIKDNYDAIYKSANKVVNDFIKYGKKSELITYIVYYSLKCNYDMKKISKLIEKIVNYKDEQPTILTPWFIKKKIYKNNLKRRKKLIENILNSLEGR
ncbi:hypothetical protein Metvu_1332 [Methanocaldococcus vulcanius M7]|uniref:Uncharacterized protein n=1 Tax=Methanocaldococcus vulcanius (strain ATCC 700851 / DSM 12094 / M7) TaxID=579137 RepID=C9RHY3_METVM|nr:hypothetical protein [Methanocaldococcus vulcanius]ACX73185.1 hypothetical protein Metvu_1332 [Methanocaldococcus vulcanius M7]